MARSKSRGGRSQLRIIGGAWRGRKLQFVPGEGLRPTADRIRETLFNWLAAHIHGAHCADLFAGSGALGLEALSRGAAHCDFIDSSAGAIRQIEGHLQTLDAGDAATCHAQTAQAFLQQASSRYDVVFLDPPFRQDLTASACDLLEQRDLLSAGALIYIEFAAPGPSPDVPANWQLYRDKVAGGVSYRLYERDA